MLIQFIQLEELLGEERQAKKDEEIVRTLQVRMQDRNPYGDSFGRILRP